MNICKTKSFEFVGFWLFYLNALPDWTTSFAFSQICIFMCDAIMCLELFHDKYFSHDYHCLHKIECLY